MTNCGGVTAFMKIAHLAEAFNLPVTSHGAHDVTVQLLAACPNRSYLEAHGFGLDRYMPSRSSSRTAAPWHRTGQATASSSTGRPSSPCGPPDARWPEAFQSRSCYSQRYVWGLTGWPLTWIS